MAKKKLQEITIIRDTREQRPLDFSPFPCVAEEVATVWPGDYTIKGWEKSIAFERKSVSDLIETMKHGYVGKASIRRYENRFDLELEEFERHFDRAFVIVEPDLPEVIRQCGGEGPVHAATQIMAGWYRAMIPPEKIFAFIRALAVEYGVHVYLAASREDAANEIVETARMYLKARRHIIHREKIRKAVNRGQESDPSAFDLTDDNL